MPIWVLRPADAQPSMQWSLTTQREKLVKMGAKVARHARCIAFRMAEVAVPRQVFADILPARTARDIPVIRADRAVADAEGKAMRRTPTSRTRNDQGRPSR